MEHNYILRMRDTAYDIVGPFASKDELSAWGAANQAASEDDPRWQSIYLADPTALPRVLTPEQAAPWPTSEAALAA
jgi:hypothetical protein